MKSAKRLIGGYILINLLSIGLDFDGSEVEITDKQILNQLDGLKKYSNAYTGIKQLKPVCVNFAYGTIEDNDVTCASAVGSLESYGDDTSVSVYASYIDEEGAIYRIAIKTNFTYDDFEGLHIESATIISLRDGEIVQNTETNTTEIGNNVEIDGQLNVNTKPVIAEGSVSEGVVTLDDLSKFKTGDIVSVIYNQADLSSVLIGEVEVTNDSITIIGNTVQIKVLDENEDNKLVFTSQIYIDKDTKVFAYKDDTFTDIANLVVDDITIKHLM